jgi:hypothetical protein
MTRYDPNPPYPWTQLGYTCDWFWGNGCEVGVSEFLVWKGAPPKKKAAVARSLFTV